MWQLFFLILHLLPVNAVYGGSSASVVCLFDLYKNVISHGVVVSNNSILLPFNIKENDVMGYNYFDGRRCSASIFSPPFKISSAKVKTLQKFGFLFESGNFTFDADIIKKINRYPFCGDERNFKIMGLSTAFEEYDLYSTDVCKVTFHNFNPKVQVCGVLPYNDDKLGIPLFSNIENVDYVAGLSIQSSSSTLPMNKETLFKFKLLNHKCYEIPIYESCEHQINIPSNYVECNTHAFSNDLMETEHDEVVIAGNIEKGYDKTFMPFGLAVIVSDHEAIVSSNVLESLENYEYFGKGKPLELAFMSKNSVIQGPKYQTYNASIIDGEKIRIIKYDKPIFKKIQKAKFLFDEKFENIADFKNDVTMLQFFNQQFAFEYGNRMNENQNFDNFLSISPMFYNGNIIGFNSFTNVKGSFISSLKLKDFLQRHASNLIFEVRTTTSTTKRPTPPLIQPTVTLDQEVVIEASTIGEIETDVTESSSSNIKIMFIPFLMYLLLGVFLHFLNL